MADKKFRKVSFIIFSAGIILLSVLTTSYGAESIRIAILDFEANDTSKFTAKAVSEFVSTEMADKKELIVIERKQIGAILNEQGFQQTGCTDQSCAVEMGKLLSAKKILLGTLTKTGIVLTITAKSVDVETGRIDFAESERCTKEEDLELASKILAVKLVNKIAGTNYTTPLRTYQQDETRNRFAVGMFYRYSIIKNVNMPTFVANRNILIESIRLTSAKRDIQNQSAVISPSYEISENFGIRMDLKYMFSELQNKIDYNSYYSTGTVNDDFFFSSYLTSFHGYGAAVNLQLIYPVQGFNFYIIPGLGIDRYKFKNPFGYIRYFNSTSSGRYDSTSEIISKSNIFCFLFKLETGFSVYVSRYVDLYFAAGVDIHMFSKFISDVKFRGTINTSTGTVPSTQTDMMQNMQMSFKGNFPPEYYAQGGLSLRLF